MTSATTARTDRAARTALTHKELMTKRDLYLGNALERSQDVALKSYIRFCNLHEFPLEPTPDSLSYYITYECTYQRPQLVAKYVMSICNQLKGCFPDVRRAQQSSVVRRTLAGALRASDTPRCQSVLTQLDLERIVDSYQQTTSHDELLFIAQLLTGFEQLLRLAELCESDDKTLRDFRKIMYRHTTTISPDGVKLLLPPRNPNKSFELSDGTKLFIRDTGSTTAAYPWLLKYIASRDTLYGLYPDLWIRADGSSPTRSWFIAQFRAHFPNVGGHSMRAGGALALAAAGVPTNSIRTAGRWSSEYYEAYIRKHPYILYAILQPTPP